MHTPSPSPALPQPHPDALPQMRRVFLLLAASCHKAFGGNLWDCTARCSGNVTSQTCVLDSGVDCEGDAYYFVAPGVIICGVVGLACCCMCAVWPLLRRFGCAGGCAATDDTLATGDTPTTRGTPATGDTDDTPATGDTQDDTAGTPETTPMVTPETEVQQAYFTQSRATPGHPCWAKFLLPFCAAVLVGAGMWQIWLSRNTFEEVLGGDVLALLQRNTYAYYDPPVEAIPAHLYAAGAYYRTRGGLQTRDVGDAVMRSREATNIDVHKTTVRYNEYDKDLVFMDVLLMVLVALFVLSVCTLCTLQCGRNYSQYGNGLAYGVLVGAALVAMVLWGGAAALAGYHSMTGDACYEVGGLRKGSGRAPGFLRGDALAGFCPNVTGAVQQVYAWGPSQAEVICDAIVPHCSESLLYQNDSRYLVCGAALLEACAANRTTLDWAESQLPGELPPEAVIRGVELKFDAPLSVRGACVGHCALQECGKRCGLATLRADANDASVALDEAVKVADYLSGSLLPLNDCRNMMHVVSTTMFEPCEDFETKVLQKFIGLILMGAGLIAVVWACAAGVKRWIPRDGPPCDDDADGAADAEALEKEVDGHSAEGWEGSEAMRQPDYVPDKLEDASPQRTPSDGPSPAASPAASRAAASPAASPVKLAPPPPPRLFEPDESSWGAVSPPSSAVDASPRRVPSSAVVEDVMV